MTRKTKKKPIGAHETGLAEKEEKTEALSGLEAGNEEPPKAKHQTLHFIIFASALILLFLGIVFIPKHLASQEFESNKYNHFEFVKQPDGLWYTMLQKGNQPYWVPFYYHPRELEDIGVEHGLRDKFFELKDNNGSIFITLDPDGGNNTIIIAGVEIAKITGFSGPLQVPTSSAFIKSPANATVNSITPIVTCENANERVMVIWLVLSDKNLAYSEGNCVVLESKSYNDMVKVADRLMYHLLGIMD